MSKDFRGCTAIIYDSNQNQLASVKIMEFYEESVTIEVEDRPELPVGELCELLILTAPIPHTFSGRIHKHGGNKIITLFKGKEQEYRHETRYNIDLPASIEGLICNGIMYPLHRPVEITVINISRDGLRIRTKHRALSDGDRIKIHVKAGDNDKLLTADVVYHKEAEQEYTEFGCHLLEDNNG